MAATKGENCSVAAAAKPNIKPMGVYWRGFQLAKMARHSIVPQDKRPCGTQKTTKRRPGGPDFWCRRGASEPTLNGATKSGVFQYQSKWLT
jgi:hypothetical protein